MNSASNNILVERIKNMLNEKGITDSQIRKETNLRIYNILKNGDKESLFDCRIYLFSIFKLCELTDTPIKEVFANI